MTLRPYQQACVRAVADAWQRGVSRQLITMATGAGKSRTVTAIPDIISLPPHKRILFLCHLDELVRQISDTFQECLPLRSVGIEKATERSGDANIVIGSIQTLGRSAGRLDQFNPDDFGLIIGDEVHLAGNSQVWRKILRHFRVLKGESPDDSKLLVGLTATPRRTDGVGLECLFDEIVFKYSWIRGVKERWLVEPKCHVVETEIDLSNVAKRAGDFAIGELENLVNTRARNELVAQKYHELTPGCPALFFTTDIKHSMDLAEVLRANGIDAYGISGKTPKEERRELIRAFKAGEIMGLCSCQVLTTGFDAPNATAAHLCRPTMSTLLLCLDVETEILTSRGWRKKGEISEGDSVPAPDPKTLDIKWVPVLKVIERKLCPCCETMLSMDSVRLDFRVSNGHRMLYRTRKRPWKIAPASSLLNISSSFQLPVAGLSNFKDVNLTDDELRFIGWFLASCNMRYSESVSETPSNFGPRKNPLHMFTICKGKPRGRLERNKRGWGYLASYIHKELAENLLYVSDRQFAILLHAIHLGDGSKYLNQTWTRRSYHISTGNKVFADLLQHACVIHGWACNMGRNKKGTYYLHTKKRVTSFVGGVGSTDRPTLREEPWKDETVWCISNSVGTLITRRNGKVVVMGNCQELGRVLRPFPAPEQLEHLSNIGQRPDWIKQNAIVIDYVDICRRHSLITTPTLIGLKPNFDAKGQSIVEVDRQVRELEQAHPTLDLRSQTSLDQIKSSTRTLDLMQPPEVPAEVRKVSKLAWLREPSGRYHIGMVKDVGLLSVVEDTLGNWQVFRHSKGMRTMLGTSRDFKEAIARAEREIPPEDLIVLKSKAAWRGREPKPEQCKYLWGIDREVRSRFKTHDDYYQHALERYNAGDWRYDRGAISTMIDRARTATG